MRTVVTTAGRPDEAAVKRTQEISAELHFPMISRNKQSVKQLQHRYNANVLVVGKDCLQYYEIGSEQPFFFHPNSAAFRGKRLLKGELDPLIEAAKLRVGDTFLDCTLGFGADSITASLVVGPTGSVVGLEANRIIAYLIREGLHHYPTDFIELKEAMQRITVHNVSALEFLKKEPDYNWDIVYIDPMFQQPIEKSSNFETLRSIGQSDQLTHKWMQEALRVCKRRVVVKDHFRSTVFQQFNMQQLIRPNTKFHYGILEKEKHRPYL